MEDGVSAELVNVTDLDLGVEPVRGPNLPGDWGPTGSLASSISAQGWKGAEAGRSGQPARAPSSSDPADRFDAIRPRMDRSFTARTSLPDGTVRAAALSSGFRWVELTSWSIVCRCALVTGSPRFALHHFYGYHWAARSSCGPRWTASGGIRRQGGDLPKLLPGEPDRGRERVSERYREKDDRISFVGQIGLKARFRLTENLSALAVMRRCGSMGRLAPISWRPMNTGITGPAQRPCLLPRALTGLEWNW